MIIVNVVAHRDSCFWHNPNVVDVVAISNWGKSFFFQHQGIVNVVAMIAMIAA